MARSCIRVTRGRQFPEAARGKAVFKTYLPCFSDGHAAEGEAVKAEKIAGSSETLLLVEDERGNRKTTAEFLGLEDNTILEATDGLDALSVAETYHSPIDLVITGVVMPNKSVGQLARELARLRRQTRLSLV